VFFLNISNCELISVSCEGVFRTIEKMVICFLGNISERTTRFPFKISTDDLTLILLTDFVMMHPEMHRPDSYRSESQPNNSHKQHMGRSTPTLF